MQNFEIMIRDSEIDEGGDQKKNVRAKTRNLILSETHFGKRLKKRF